LVAHSIAGYSTHLLQEARKDVAIQHSIQRFLEPKYAFGVLVCA